jgi:hypothetical protein
MESASLHAVIFAVNETSDNYDEDNQRQSIVNSIQYVNIFNNNACKLDFVSSCRVTGVASAAAHLFAAGHLLCRKQSQDFVDVA